MTNLPQPLALNRKRAQRLYDRIREEVTPPYNSPASEAAMSSLLRFVGSAEQVMMRGRHFSWVWVTSSGARIPSVTRPCFGTFDNSRPLDAEAAYVQMNYRRDFPWSLKVSGLQRILRVRICTDEQMEISERIIRYFLDPEVSPYWPVLEAVQPVWSEDENGNTVLEGLIYKDGSHSRAMFVNLCIACRSAFTHPAVLASVQTILANSDATIPEAILAGEMMHFPSPRNFVELDPEDVSKLNPESEILAGRYVGIGAAGFRYVVSSGDPRSILKGRVFSRTLGNQAPSVTFGRVSFRNWLTGVPAQLSREGFHRSVPTNYIWDGVGRATQAAYLTEDSAKFFNLDRNHPSVRSGKRRNKPIVVTVPQGSGETRRNTTFEIAAYRHPQFPTSAGFDAWENYENTTDVDAWGFRHTRIYNSLLDPEMDGTSELWAQNVIYRIRQIASGVEPTFNFGKEFPKEHFAKKPEGVEPEASALPTAA